MTRLFYCRNYGRTYVEVVARSPREAAEIYVTNAPNRRRKPDRRVLVVFYTQTPKKRLVVEHMRVFDVCEGCDKATTRTCTHCSTPCCAACAKVGCGIAEARAAKAAARRRQKRT